jgi:hypothetical protein
VRSRSIQRRALAGAATALISFFGRELGAQRVLGVGADATVLPRGAVRMSAEAIWTTYNELYGPGGRLEALGAPLSIDSLGVRQLGILRPIETTLRSLAGTPSARITLGPVRTDFTARIARSAFVLDFGLTSRIMLTGRLPYEHTTSEVVLQANPSGVTANLANIGVNPALDAQSPAAAQNRKVVDSVSRAVEELTARLAGCASTPGDPVCTDRSQVEALLAEARAFTAGLAATYGTGADTARGEPFVPLTGSTLQVAIEQRLAALHASFATFIPSLSAWDKPFPAQVPITSAQTQGILTEALGIAPIGLIERSHIGDVEVGAKVLLLDTFGGLAGARAARGSGMRLAVGGLVRFGTGQRDTPDDLADVGTGDGQTDVEVSGATDLVLNRRLWASVVGRYGMQLADEPTLRIPDVPRDPFLEASRQQRVSRDLGDYFELEVTPRFVYNDYLSLSAQWVYRRKSADQYTGTFTIDGADGEPTVIDARVLGVDTEQDEQRVGVGITYSTLRALDRRHGRLPLEVRFLHSQSVSGSGFVPKRFSSELQLRVYLGLLGEARR